MAAGMLDAEGLDDLFDQVDVSGDGTISKQELLTFLIGMFAEQKKKDL